MKQKRPHYGNLTNSYKAVKLSNIKEETIPTFKFSQHSPQTATSAKYNNGGSQVASPTDDKRTA